MTKVMNLLRLDIKKEQILFVLCPTFRNFAAKFVNGKSVNRK